MKIAIAADHGGYEYKEIFKKEIEEKGHSILDLGAHTKESSDDYPDFAGLMAEKILNGTAERGVLICGSGVGVAVAANKFKGVKAGLCHDNYSAHQCVEHDDVNVLCLGQRVIGIELAREIIFTFLSAEFSREPRHQRRLDKLKKIESRNFR